MSLEALVTRWLAAADRNERMAAEFDLARSDRAAERSITRAVIYRHCATELQIEILSKQQELPGIPHPG